MSGFDKYWLEQILITLGWRDAGDNMVIPPDALLDDNKGVRFYIYDARDLQNLLGDPVPEEEAPHD